MPVLVEPEGEPKKHVFQSILVGQWVQRGLMVISSAMVFIEFAVYRPVLETIAIVDPSWEHAGKKHREVSDMREDGELSSPVGVDGLTEHLVYILLCDGFSRLNSIKSIYFDKQAQKVREVVDHLAFQSVAVAFECPPQQHVEQQKWRDVKQDVPPIHDLLKNVLAFDHRLHRGRQFVDDRGDLIVAAPRLGKIVDKKSQIAIAQSVEASGDEIGCFHISQSQAGYIATDVRLKYLDREQNVIHTWQAKFRNGRSLELVARRGRQSVISKNIVTMLYLVGGMFLDYAARR